jgi:hypothetical protein
MDGFYALVVGLGFAINDMLYVLEIVMIMVSMPSLSGWALRWMPCGRVADVLLRCPFRHPLREQVGRQGFQAFSGADPC